MFLTSLTIPSWKESLLLRAHYGAHLGSTYTESPLWTDNVLDALYTFGSWDKVQIFYTVLLTTSPIFPGFLYTSITGQVPSCLETFAQTLPSVWNIIFPDASCIQVVAWLLRAIWLRHLSSHRSSGLIRLICLARQVPPPPSRFHVCPSKSCALVEEDNYSQ